MPTSVIEYLRRAVLPRDGTLLGDGELLGRFVERHDEAALAALVERHGPMVWGVCRRLLSHHDAEDAFQATFLVFVRKAASVVPREMVGNWLYGVAHKAALQARRVVVKRRAREIQVIEMPDIEAMPQDQQLGEQPLLDQELSRLPDNYRAVLVLCDLEGQTRKEVARQLGVPEGTVAGRLARARAMLAKRLAQRGVTSSGGALAAVLAQNVASACVPTSVVSNTISAANLFAASRAVISSTVAALTEGVLKVMLMSKLKAAVAAVLVLGLMVTGATVLTCRLAAQGEGPPAASAGTVPARGGAKVLPKQEKDAFTAWGKAAGGLQAGLGFRPGEKRAYRHGETVTLVVRVRNVDKKAVKFQYLRPYFAENPPNTTDADSKPVRQEKSFAGGTVHRSTEVNLAPGKEIELAETKYELRSLIERDNGGFKAPKFLPLYGTGKVSLQYDRVFGNSMLSKIAPDPTLSKLGTGKLELEIKSDAPAAPEKEAFTAWGKAAGGLQAGLGFRPGEKRVYRHRETVTLVVRVRNVGKKEIPVHYVWAYFVENAPAVTDTGGKPVPAGRPLLANGLHVPKKVDLARGKAVDLYELKLELKPGNEVSWDTLRGSGKVRLQYKHLAGTTSTEVDGKIPVQVVPLSKLATGALELEIEPGTFPAATGKE